MKAVLEGGTAFSYITITLDPGEQVIAESGAMQSMDAGLDMDAKPNGGFFSALGKRTFGGESFFVNHFRNNKTVSQNLVLAQDVPGQIVEIALGPDQEICLQRGSFLACTPGVSLSTAWAGFASWIGGEGLVKLRARGQGILWFGAYGGILTRQVSGELLVDSGHLVAYDPGLSLGIRAPGGAFASIFGGEGLVTRLQGQGTVYLQTRSIRGLAAWLNPKFR
ncbi:TIGR00266 family protein [Spirochaeta lutea]|uniref:TIGR00266 family protein n=1 Tax=Spirochaeta lutea TaxID=1480694 RepID=A0A098R2K2_9SPIO|nr:TIGR00266 family protein [Spirochaeta lutea]KGE73883.1 hypothetical protein DC28_01385 [Spirochaeta lutea]